MPSRTEESAANADGGRLRRRLLVVLSCAGGLTVTATFIQALMWASIINSDPNHHSWGMWGGRIFIPLTMMLIATVLGAAAVFSPLQTQPLVEQPRGTFTSWAVLSGLLVVHIGLASLYFGNGPGPKIDTFTFQRDASTSLIHGINPYGSTQANIFDDFHTPLFYAPGMVVNGRVLVGFQYPPITLLWILPGYLLGDVRFSYILAIILSALFAFLICPNARGLWIAAALLLSPVTYLVEYLCWTEPLVLMALSVSVYAAVKNKWWLAIAIGLFLSTKQYNFLTLPLLGLLVHPFTWKAYWRLAVKSTAIALATVLPFALWNFRGLWHDLVLFHLKQPFRQDAVSFAVPFPWMLKLGPVLLLVFITWAVWKAKASPVTFAACYGVALMLFVIANKQAFTNYYFLIGNVFFLAAAAIPALAKNLSKTRA
jgi:hypothetical protein